MRYDPRTDQAKTYEELAYSSVSREEAATNRQRRALADLDHDTAVALGLALGLKPVG